MVNGTGKQVRPFVSKSADIAVVSTLRHAEALLENGNIIHYEMQKKYILQPSFVRDGKRVQATIPQLKNLVSQAVSKIEENMKDALTRTGYKKKY